MIVVYQRHDLDSTEPVLAYDGEEEQLWGLPEPWQNNLPLVGLTEEQFAEFFDGPNLFASEAEEGDDPFEQFPAAEDYMRNYPPGSEEMPDVETREPLSATRDGDDAEKAAERLTDSFLEVLEAKDSAVTSGTSGAGQARYSPEDDEDEEEIEDITEKVADDALNAALKEDWGEDDFEEADDVLFEMHKRLVWWKADEPNPDLDKAPPMWSGGESVPEFVKEVIRQVIEGDVVWDHFEGYTRRAGEIVQEELENALTQPQGWSIKSLVERIREEYPGMEMEQAVNIARTETSAVLNSAREEAYEEREDADEYVYYWQGPSDHRTTKVCEEIKEEVEDRGGNVPLSQLKSILRNKAKKYEGTREGGTPERVSEWTPHYQCRHTFIRDVKADL